MALNILKAFAFASVRFQACSFSFRCGFEMPLVRNNFGQECEKNQRSFRSFEHV